MTDAAFRKPDRTSPLPLWAQIMADLRVRLSSGEFAEGLPPERELIEQYEVSRHTMRDAMRRLHSEGLIDRERGRGTFLRTRPIEQTAGSLYSLFRSIEDQGFEQRSDVLELDEREAPAIADSVKMPSSTRFIYLHRVRNADETPVATDEIWMPAAIASPLLGVDFRHTAVYVELDRLCGARPEAGWERIHPVIPSADERKALGLKRQEPGFLVERCTTFAGSPLEWRRTVIRGDMYTFVTEWQSPLNKETSSFAPTNALPG